MKYRNWQIPYTAPQPPEALLRAGYSPLLAVLLALRGYADPGQARDFLSGGDQSVFDPMLLQDMDKAVARIRTAIERRENVAVFGDYDVDGITSTCVLTDYLRRQGVPVHPYIPDRIEEGYGLNMDAITSLQRTSDITLIITVDCGITAIDETNYALQRGIDMVITDHHECSGQAIPNAVAVVDPKRPGSQYPNSGLAGVGVAYKLLCALEGGSEQVLRKYGDLVAIGTVADVMPLTGENRYLVAQGLAQINARPRPGIRALLHECGAEGRPVTATTIGFTLAPRINAAGRLGKTAVAALLLLTQDDGEADRYAAGLCQLNRERQALEQQLLRARKLNQADAGVQAAALNAAVVAVQHLFVDGVCAVMHRIFSFQNRLRAVCVPGENGLFRHGGRLLSAKIETNIALRRAGRIPLRKIAGKIKSADEKAARARCLYLLFYAALALFDLAGGLGGLGFGNGLRCGCLGRRDGLDAHFGLAHLGAMPLGQLETRLRAALRLGFGRMCSALLGFLDQRVLRIEQRLAGFGQRAELRVAAVGQKLAQLGGVAQARVEVLQHLLAQGVIKNRPGNLHALLHVARHQVGA